MQYRLASLQQRYLQVEVLQDLDQRGFETRYFETVLDASNETNGIDLRADVLQEATDKGYDQDRRQVSKVLGGLEEREGERRGSKGD